MNPIREPETIELPRGVVAESSAPLPVIQFPDGSTEPAPAGSVKAEDIIGLITSEQIEELEAAKIGGKLTAEQIESIHAAQIVGQLVGEQIQFLEAHKITGELEAAQIKSLPTEKLTGFISNAQVKELEAAKITGEIKETQIGNEAITTAKLHVTAVTAAKIAASAITAEKIAVEAVEANAIKALTITAAKIAAGAIVAEKIGAEAVEASKIKALAVTSAKIEALAITTEKIAASAITTAKLSAEAITAEKISASAITTSKIAAGAITVEKLTVAELSGITPKLGTITAGIIEGVDIRLPESNELTGQNSIEWRNAGIAHQKIFGSDPEPGLHILGLQTTGKLSVFSEILVTASETFSSVTAAAGTIKTIINSEGKSHFVQLKEAGKHKIWRGTFTLTWTASAASNAVEVAHSLGETPEAVICAPRTSPSFGKIPTFNIVERSETKFTVNAETKEAWSGSIVCMFIAMS